MKKLITYAGEKCREKGIQPEEALDQVMAMVTDEEGKTDLSTVLSLTGLFGSGETDAEPESEDEEEGLTYIQVYNMRNEAFRKVFMEEYRDADMGDEQINLAILLTNEEDNLEEAFGVFELLTYTADGTDLKLNSREKKIAYMVFTIDDEANFELAEDLRAESDDDINALCRRHKIERDDFDYYTDDMHADWDAVYLLGAFLEDHPEYERIEFRGAMRTKEELETLEDEILDEILESFDTRFN